MAIDERAFEAFCEKANAHGSTRNIYQGIIEGYEAAKTQQPVGLSRKDFEDWCEADAYPCELSYRFSKDEDGDYTYAETASQWHAWQAAIARSPKRESGTLTDGDKREIVNLMASRAEAMGDISMLRNMGNALSAILSDPRFEIRRRA